MLHSSFHITTAERAPENQQPRTHNNSGPFDIVIKSNQDMQDGNGDLESGVKPDGLTSTELKTLEEYSLGRGIDITLPNPLDSRCGFTCKLTTGAYTIQKNCATETHKQSLIILSRSEVQAGLKLGATAPQAPVRAFASAQFSRSETMSKRVKYKHVSSNRYDVYKAKRNNLETDLEDYRDQHKSDKNWCRAFLKEHGNMTHYVSSITLGAMKYEMEMTEGRNLGGRLSAGVDNPLGVVMEGSIGLGSDQEWSEAQTGMIGEFSENGETVKKETAIFYEYTLLSHLVTDPKIKKCLDDAIRNYLEECYPQVKGKSVIINCIERTNILLTIVCVYERV